MTWNLLVYKWADAYDTPAKRKKHKVRMRDVSKEFAENGDHPAIGPCDYSGYLKEIFSRFGPESYDLPFVLERYENCVVFNYANSNRFEIVPVLGKLAMAHGLHASEF